MILHIPVCRSSSLQPEQPWTRRRSAPRVPRFRETREEHGTAVLNAITFDWWVPVKPLGSITTNVQALVTKPHGERRDGKREGKRIPRLRLDPRVIASDPVLRELT
jgi:hypothetical protein